MSIKKMVAAAITAALVLTLTACGNNEKPSGNSGGASTVQTGSNSANGSTPVTSGAENSVPASEPVKGLGIWDVLPEIPVTDANAFTYKYNSELGGITVTDYSGASSEVRIPDTFEGKSVVEVDFRECKKKMTQLVMPDSVKKFELREFKLFEDNEVLNALQYVNIPRSMNKIEERAFWVYAGLTSVFIPNSIMEIRDSAFSNCTSLTSITIPDSVNTIGDGAFACCTSLTSINIPDSVTNIGDQAFDGCKNLTNIIIPDSVTKIGYNVFRECSGISATYKGKTYDYNHIDDLYKAINGN